MIRKIILLLSLSILFCSCGVNNNNYELEYELKENEYIVTGYQGNPINIDIPSTYNNLPVTSIAKSCFANASSLIGINIPDSITYIGTGVFLNCTSLKNVKLSNSIDILELSLFEGCSALEEITIPDNVISMQPASLARCTSLKRINISPEAKLESYSAQALLYTNNIETIIIPRHMKKLDSSYGAFPFYDIASNIYSITTYSEDLVSIEERDLPRLIEVVNKSSLNLVPLSDEYGGFLKRVKNVINDLKDTKLIYKDNGDVIYQDDKETILVNTTCKDGHVVVEEGITRLYDHFLYRNIVPLASITLPSSLRVIDDNVLLYATTRLIEIYNYSSIDISSSSIGLYIKNLNHDKARIVNDQSESSVWLVDESFILYRGIGTLYLISYIGDEEKVTIPVGVDEIYSFAFFERRVTNEVNIPLSVKEIDKEAFAYNYGEFTLSYEGSVAEWNNITLHNRWNATSSLKVVHCKDGDIILN